MAAGGQTENVRHDLFVSPRRVRVGAGAAVLGAWLVAGCSREPASPHPEAAGELHAPTEVARVHPTPPSPAPPVPSAPRSPAADDACIVEVHARPAAGWSLTGFRPGPVLQDVVAATPHRLAARTRTRLCTSDDGGARWTERLRLEEPATTLALARVDKRRSWLATARRAGTGAVTALFVSNDGDVESWTRVTPPPGLRELRAAVTDGHGGIFVATDTQLFESTDLGASWSAARPLPGREAEQVDACGSVLIAHARVDQDWFYHRSLDHGATWRPFRLGAIGLEGNTAMLRCLTEAGGVEAGRSVLPSHWSFDGGQTWRRGGHDSVALQSARALAERPGEGVAPHCTAGPGGTTACLDSGRLRLLYADGRVQEIRAPAGCLHARQIDTRRTLAFGAGCGLYESRDRGGVWRMISQSLAARAPGAESEGRGGFVDGRTAWRLDGGLWWTADRGAHWRHVYSALGRTLEHGVFVDAQRGVFATNQGWVVATRDGGRSWTYILRGEVERIASAGRAVMVTTTQTVRVSLDGGLTWLSAGAQPPQTPLDPTVEMRGGERVVSLAPEVRVVQRDDQLALVAPGAEGATLLQGLPPGYRLLAVHARGARPDGILLEGGAILARSDD